METLRRRLLAIWPVLLGGGWLLCLFGPLLSPGRALANRDIAVFHLPLRATFRDLAAFGLPVWNPWLHGGQPILSNPSYGAFYPPSWLAFLVPPYYALSLMVVLHAAVAFAGAWHLARHFGCGRGVAALAAVGYVGCGAYLSLLSAYTLFGSMAWFPWVLAWGDESLRTPAGERWWRPGLLAGGALGLQLLNGEPSTVVMSGLALLALAAAAAVRRPAAAARVLLPVLFAVALAAAQLLPTLDRLGDSPRKQLSRRVATTWSMPPQRFVEMVFPRFFGDPTRDAEGLFFGWHLNDEDYPYVELLYPGLLLAVLGASALLAGRIPRRAAWALVLGAGGALALGRHDPVYEAVRQAVPVLAILRYPEKFILLAVFALTVAGALGWQRLLDERDASRPAAADLPLAVALVVLATGLSLTAVLIRAPFVVDRFVAAYGSPLLTPARRSAALAFLRGESWAAVGTASAVVLLLALCRWRRPPRRLLEALAVLLLAADLWHYGHVLVQTFPADFYRRPPAAARALLPARDRIFLQEAAPDALAVSRRRDDPRTVYTRNHVLMLEPYSGLLWHLPYAFDLDFELMLTDWGRKAEEVLLGEKPETPSIYRYVGAWNVGTFLLHKTIEQQKAALDDPAALPLIRVRNPYVLPRFRCVPEVTFHPGHAAALAAARAEGWRVGRHEHCVRPGRPPATLRYARPPQLLGITDEGGRIEFRYRAADGAFFVAAMTYDKGWRAAVDGRPLATYPSAACQLGVALPRGEHRLVLRFREPLAVPGAAVSLIALAAGAAALLVPERRRRMA
jgi:hypothetical protein